MPQRAEAPTTNPPTLEPGEALDLARRALGLQPVDLRPGESRTRLLMEAHATTRHHGWRWTFHASPEAFTVSIQTA